MQYCTHTLRRRTLCDVPSPPPVPVPRLPAETVPAAGAFAYVCVAERPAPGAAVDVPPWFDAWFDGLFPDAGSVAGYRAKEVADRLGLSSDAVYAALYDGRLEGCRATCRGWLVPGPAVRYWLLAHNSVNLLALPGTRYDADHHRAGHGRTAARTARRDVGAAG